MFIAAGTVVPERHQLIIALRALGGEGGKDPLEELDEKAPTSGSDCDVGNTTVPSVDS